MKLHCLGAGQEVGRSALLLKGKNENILLDYGLKLNPTTHVKADMELPAKTEHPKAIKEPLAGIILSHAHLDHSGAIPSLYKEANVPLFLTEATLELSNLLWKDTLKIAKLTGEDCGFKPQQVDDTNNSAFYIDYRVPVQISPNIKITFFDAGHIVGSVMALIEMDKKKILYTGDFRATESQMFRGYDRKLPQVDILITETTYADAPHKNRKEQEKLLVDEIRETLDNRGIVILPAFAIERSQELVSILDRYNIKVPVYLDGMAKKATTIFAQYPNQFVEYARFKKAVDRIEFIKNQKKREKIVATNTPCIIITTAGMLEGGPVLGYIRDLGDDPRNKIILTGYQVEGTNGRRLFDKGKLYIDGKIYSPRAKVTKHSFSAHADKLELLELVKKVNPKKVICIHGDKDVTFDFKNELKKLGINAENPAVGDIVDLD
ncbi:MAG TPA: MBL fold metallo-hydrolase RNA specificity domain-containing protein [archaeon]|mgnify:CR=1 FL=1|jgi:putative mRNA 3-end processing factor|nr:MBL fold metallo-hydrolase RNA specificity domain-containing protein [archaeon]